MQFPHVVPPRELDSEPNRESWVGSRAPVLGLIVRVLDQVAPGTGAEGSAQGTQDTQGIQGQHGDGEASQEPGAKAMSWVV